MSKGRGVVTSTEVVVVGFCVPFFACELERSLQADAFLYHQQACLLIGVIDKYGVFFVDFRHLAAETCQRWLRLLSLVGGEYRVAGAVVFKNRTAER